MSFEAMGTAAKTYASLRHWYLWVFTFALVFIVYQVLFVVAINFMVNWTPSDIYRFNITSTLFDVMALFIFLACISVLHLIKNDRSTFLLYLLIIFILPLILAGIDVVADTRLSGRIFMVVASYFASLFEALSYHGNEGLSPEIIHLLPLWYAAMLTGVYAMFLFRAERPLRLFLHMLAGVLVFYFVFKFFDKVVGGGGLFQTDKASSGSSGRADFWSLIHFVIISMVFGTVGGYIAGWPLLDHVLISDQARMKIIKSIAAILIFCIFIMIMK